MKYLAKKHGKKITEIEETLGSSSGYLSKHLKRGIVPSLPLVLCLADLFDISVEVLCDVDLTESGEDGVCTFVQAHGKHIGGICYENRSVEKEIAVLAKKLMVSKRDVVNSVYSCIPEKLRTGETIEECVQEEAKTVAKELEKQREELNLKLSIIYRQ